MKKILFLASFVALMAASPFSPAFAKCGNQLAYMKLDELKPFSTPELTDKNFMCDDSTNEIKQTTIFQSPISAAFGTSIVANAIEKATVQTATVAEVNTGKPILAGVPNRKIYVHSLRILVNGSACSGSTTVDFQDTNGTPVAVTSFPIASLTSGAILAANSGTQGVGIVTGLTTGAGLSIVKTGGTLAGCTSITYNISYSVI